MMRSTTGRTGLIGTAAIAAALGLAAWTGSARAGEADRVTVVERTKDGATRSITGTINSDDFDRVIITVRQSGVTAQQSFDRPNVESVTYGALGDTFQEAVDAFERENNHAECVRILRELSESVKAAKMTNPQQAEQHILWLRARALFAAAREAATPDERNNRLKNAQATIDELLKTQRNTAHLFDALLLRQEILVQTNPAEAKQSWNLLVDELKKHIGKAKWATRYLLGAQLHQIRSEVDDLIAKPGNDGRVQPFLAQVAALEKSEDWTAYASSAEQSQATQLRLVIYQYLKRVNELQTELGKAIRQAQLENAAADLKACYLMRGDNAYALSRSQPSGSDQAKRLANDAFMDYLRVFTIYGEQLGDQAPEVALKLGTLYLELKGPDWFDRAQELADAARRGPTRAAAEELLKKIQEQKPPEPKEEPKKDAKADAPKK